MKIAELKTFVVGNPPPAFGGRYFLFLKLKTACGIEGVGEVYAASFAPEGDRRDDRGRVRAARRSAPIRSASRPCGATSMAAAIPAGPTFR